MPKSMLKFEAEKNEIMHASAIEHSSDNEISFEVPSINFDNNEKFVPISKKDLHKIIKHYLEDILKWTKLIISKSGYDKLISKQLIITGGGSQLDGLSILAKNYRDDLMKNLSIKYDKYSWESNFGYPTKKHRDSIKKYGTTKYHRKSFKLL